jgi:bis(5'-nucleosyl)-tetraphosphatase (symmetrical)
MMANYAVGDIQGCFEEFKEGLDLIKFKSSKDFLWITGDLINRGPESLKVLEYVFKIKNSVHIVLGNHDLHYLNCFFNKKNLSDEDTFQSQMFNKKSLKMAKFLLQQPFVFSKKVLTKKRVIQVAMVHAGIPRNMSLKRAETLSKLCGLELINDPKKNLKKIFENKRNFTSIESFSSLINFFTRVRVVNKNGLPNFSFKGRKKNIPPDLITWFKKENKIMNDIDLLVFGHWAALEGKTDVSNIIALDTGCCWGKELTFLRLEDQKKFIVKSKQK